MGPATIRKDKYKMKSSVICLAGSEWNCCLGAHARGIWLLALCWMVVALGCGEVSADDVVFKPVANTPIVDNFVQVHNPSGEAGSYTIQFADNESDLVLDRVEGDLDAGASTFVYLDAVDVDDARLLTVTVSSTFPGFAQHFVWDPQRRVLSNWSSCSVATVRGSATVPGVRSGASVPFHGGQIIIERSYGASEPMSIQVYAGDTGVNLGEWNSPVILEGGMITVDVEEILAEVSSTNLETDTFNLAAGSGFAGRLQYTVGGPGDTTVDLTAKCRLGPWQSPSQVRREGVSDLAPMSSIKPERDVEVRQRERPSFETYANRKHGSPELGTGATITWSFYEPRVSTLYDGHRPCRSVSYLGDVPCLESDIPDRLKGYVRRAYDIWSQAAGVTFVELPPESPIVNYRVGLGVQNRGLAGWSGMDLVARHLTRQRGPSRVMNGYTPFNGDAFGNSRILDYGFLDIALQAIGHNLGINHDFLGRGFISDRNIMRWFIYHRPVMLEGLTEDDISGIQFLYGPSAQVSKTYIDDFDGHARTGALIAPGETISGKIDFAGDEDWFEVSLTGEPTFRRSYLFEVTPGDDQAQLNKPSLQLYWDHNRAGANPYPDPFLANTGRNEASVAFSPQHAGVYWIAVSGDAQTTGSYKLSVMDLTTVEQFEEEETEVAISEGEEDFPHNLESEGFVPIDGSATGTLDSAVDRDFFRVKLVSGAKYEFTVAGREDTGTDPLEDPVSRS